MSTRIFALVAAITFAVNSSGAVLTFGDEDCLNQACYGVNNPVSGATLEGLATDVITLAALGFGHIYPFSPSADFPGTDQIFAGSNQTSADDGYSTASERIAGPAVFTLDYSSLLGPGLTLATLTLGIGADDFQFPTYSQPFSVSVNGAANSALQNQLNTTDLGGPKVQFFTIGLNPAIDNPSHILTLAIDVGGDGGDGFAVDFLTIGVTTTQVVVGGVPESSTLPLVGIGVLLVVISRVKIKI